SSRRRHTRFSRDWSSDVCSSDLEHPDDIPQSRSSGRGDHSDLAGQRRQRLLARRIKKPFLFQLGLELLKGEMQISNSLGEEHFYIELVLSIGFVHSQGTEGDNSVSVFGHKGQQTIAAAEHDGLNPAVG